LFAKVNQKPDTAALGALDAELMSGKAPESGLDIVPERAPSATAIGEAGAIGLPG